MNPTPKHDQIIPGTW